LSRLTNLTGIQYEHLDFLEILVVRKVICLDELAQKVEV
jgi:hypothetical protein